MVRYQNHRVLTVNKAPRFSDKQQTTEGTHPHSLKKTTTTTRKSHVNWERAREENTMSLTDARVRATVDEFVI